MNQEKIGKLLFITILFLLGTGLVKAFLRAFVIIVGKRKDVSKTEILQAKAAVQLVSNTLIGVGLLESTIGFISLMLWNIGTPLSEGGAALSGGLYVTALSILYGVLGYLILLPIRTRLQILENTLEK